MHGFKMTLYKLRFVDHVTAYEEMLIILLTGKGRKELSTDAAFPLSIVTQDNHKWQRKVSLLDIFQQSNDERTAERIGMS